MKLTKEQLQTIKETLELAQYHLYNELDAICDKDCLKETEDVIEGINHAIALIDGA